jgi:triacylglycerol esterase/lipase EstA (alpha/beta hydrolase family)
MLARIQQSIVFLLVAIAVAWAGYCIARGAQAWAAGGLLLVVLGYLVAIGCEFWSLERSYSPDDRDRPTRKQLLSAWWSEVLAAPPVFLWRQPFRSRAICDSPSPTVPRRRGVVLVHGFFCNRGIWNPWMERFLEVHVPFVAVNLEPVLGSIDEYAPRIEAAVSRLETATGRAPVVVAHSMGGLAVRAWLRQLGCGRLHHLVTIGTPHRGTAMARRAWAKNSRQMRIGSSWLEALSAAEASQVRVAVTCFWSRCDNIVFPIDSATLPGADNRHLDATPHVRMVYHPQVFAEVMRLVASAQSLPAGYSEKLDDLD